MLSIKNWDNKIWISSTKYIKLFNNILLKKKLNQSFKKNHYFNDKHNSIT